MRAISTRRWWVILWRMLVLLMLINAFGPAIGRVEGKVFPVINFTEIETVEERDGSSYFTGSAFKLRDCDFRGITWFAGSEHGVNANAELLRMDRDGARKIETFRFGPWAVRMTEKDLRENSFAEVYHSCHALFPTVTRFYPPVTSR